MLASIDAAAVFDRALCSEWSGLEPGRFLTRVGNGARAPQAKQRRKESRSSDKEVTNCLARRERCRRGPFTSKLRSRARNDLRTFNRQSVEAKCVNVAGEEYGVARRLCVS